MFSRLLFRSTVGSPMLGLRTLRCVALACLAAAAFLDAAPIGAQSPAAGPLVPAVGARVRVSSASSLPVIGTLVRATPDTLVLVPERGGGALALARADLGSFEVSRGRPSRVRAAAPWALGGALLWGLAFAVVETGPCTPDMTRAECEDASNRSVASNAAGGAALGAVLGGAFGALFRRGERWQAATFPVRIALTLPSSHSPAAGLAVSLRWR